MTDYTMPVLSEQERGALISLAKIELSRWRIARDKQYMVTLMEIALAALTAEPVAYDVKGILCHTLDEAEIYVGEPEPLYDVPPVPVKQEGERCGKCKGNGWFADEMGMRRCFMCNDLVREGGHRD